MFWTVTLWSSYLHLYYVNVSSNNIPRGFEFKLEVYGHVLHDDLSIASTPRKLKNKIANSVGRTVGRKLAASLVRLFAFIHECNYTALQSSLFLCSVHNGIIYLFILCFALQKEELNADL